MPLTAQVAQDIVVELSIYAIYCTNLILFQNICTMRCPYCECTNTKVVDSRESGASIRRRRECALCGRRFTTYERAQTKSMMVVKRDGRREEFSRDKLWASLTKACAKRPLAVGSIDRMIDDIEANLSEQGKAEFPSQSIGEMVMGRLSDLDQVAYIRFASVYLDFSDAESFKTAIDALLETSDSSNGHADINQLALLDGDGSAGECSSAESPPQEQPDPST